MAEDTMVLPLMNDLVGCLCTALVDSPGGSPCFCGLMPGVTVPMDFCDCSGLACGMAWVRLVRIYPSNSIPNQLQDVTSCVGGKAATFELGVTRCLPGMDELGNPPDEAAQAEAVRVQMGDMVAMLTAIECCEIGTKKRPAILSDYRPIDSRGNCGGGVWQFTMRVR